jgi:hypothetical protein
MDILRKTVREWHAAGFVERVSDMPHCCNPLTVAVQYNAITDSVKHRPCIDLSRHVNFNIAHSPAKLDDLLVAQQLVSQNDFMTSFDLENQFFQVRLNPSMRKYLGFCIVEESGCPEFHQFLVMPYGCKPAVSVVTRLLKPVKSFLHRLGIRFSIYVDNAMPPPPPLHAGCIFVSLTYLSWLDGVYSGKKTMIHPTTRLLHLGFLTDTVSMTYSITPDKWSSLVADTLIAAAASEPPVSVHILASLLGKLASFRRSHGPVVRVLTRHLQHDLGSHIAIHDWHSSLTLSPAAELPRLVLLLSSFNHRRISSAADESLTTADADLPLPATCLPPPPLSSLHQYRLAVNGSLFTVLMLPPPPLVTILNLSPFSNH